MLKWVCVQYVAGFLSFGLFVCALFCTAIPITYQKIVKFKPKKLSFMWIAFKINRIYVYVVIDMLKNSHTCTWYHCGELSVEANEGQKPISLSQCLAKACMKSDKKRATTKKTQQQQPYQPSMEAIANSEEDRKNRNKMRSSWHHEHGKLRSIEMKFNVWILQLTQPHHQQCRERGFCAKDISYVCRCYWYYNSIESASIVWNNNKFRLGYDFRSRSYAWSYCIWDHNKCWTRPIKFCEKTEHWIQFTLRRFWVGFFYSSPPPPSPLSPPACLTAQNFFSRSFQQN